MFIWDSNIFDDASYWSSGANTKLSIPSGKGGAGTRFRIYFRIALSNTTNGDLRYQLYLRKNGTTRLTMHSIQSHDNTFGYGISGEYIDNAPADGDYYELAWYRAQSGTTIYHAFDGGNNLTAFGIEKLK